MYSSYPFPYLINANSLVCILACMCAKSFHLCLALCDPMDYNLPGSSVHGILRTLQEYCSGLPCPSPADLSNAGIEPTSLMSPALAGGFFATSTTWEARILAYLLLILLIAQVYLHGDVLLTVLQTKNRVTCFPAFSFLLKYI